MNLSIGAHVSYISATSKKNYSGLAKGASTTLSFDTKMKCMYYLCLISITVALYGAITARGYQTKFDQETQKKAARTSTVHAHRNSKINCFVPRPRTERWPVLQRACSVEEDLIGNQTPAILKLFKTSMYN